MRTSNNETNIRDNLNKIKDQFKKLNEKVNCANFDAEINYLKSLINNIKT